MANLELSKLLKEQRANEAAANPPPSADEIESAKRMIRAAGGVVSEEMFEFMLMTAEKIEKAAEVSARGIDLFSHTARDLARQRRMNAMVDDFVIMLEEMCNVTVEVNRLEQTGRIPLPPRIDHLHTMLNFKNRR